MPSETTSATRPAGSRWFQFSLTRLLGGMALCALIFLWVRFFTRFDIRVVSDFKAVTGLYNEILTFFDFQVAAAGTLIVLIGVARQTNSKLIRYLVLSVIVFAVFLMAAFLYLGLTQAS